MSSTPQTITGRVQVSWTMYETLAYGAVPSSNAPATGTITDTISYSNGTSGTAASINLHFEDATTPITLTSGSNQTFTLSNLTDGLNRNFSMAGGVRTLIIYVTSRTAGDYLTFAPGASDGWTALVSGTTPLIKIWDLFCVGVAQTDVYAITAGSNDQFTIHNAGANPITFQIGIGGCNS